MARIKKLKYFPFILSGLHRQSPFEKVQRQIPFKKALCTDGIGSTEQASQVGLALLSVKVERTVVGFATHMGYAQWAVF